MGLRRRGVVGPDVRHSGLVVVLVSAAVLLVGGLVVPARSATAEDNRDLTAVHRLSIELYASAFDDDDDPTDFDPPPASVTPKSRPGSRPSWPTRRPQRPTPVSWSWIYLPWPTRRRVAAHFGFLHDTDGLRISWWRGPFWDANGIGALPQHGSVALCFQDQYASWS